MTPTLFILGESDGATADQRGAIDAETDLVTKRVVDFLMLE